MLIFSLEMERQNKQQQQNWSLGQWLWLSWQSGNFQYQRSTVRIQSLANLYKKHLFTVNCIEMTK